MLMGFSKLKKWPKSVQGWQRCKPKRVAVALSRAKVALRMFCMWPRKWSGRNACATFFAVSSLCLDRFCSFFRFSKSQYAFLKDIFYDFFVLTSTKSFMSSCMWEKGKRCAGRDIYQETQQIQNALLQYVSLYVSN